MRRQTKEALRYIVILSAAQRERSGKRRDLFAAIKMPPNHVEQVITNSNSEKSNAYLKPFSFFHL